MCLYVFVCSVHQETNHLIDRLQIVQNCQLELIHGSQVDWFSDAELCKLVCELGEPIAERVD